MRPCLQQSQRASSHRARYVLCERFFAKGLALPHLYTDAPSPTRDVRFCLGNCHPGYPTDVLCSLFLTQMSSSTQLTPTSWRQALPSEVFMFPKPMLSLDNGPATLFPPGPISLFFFFLLGCPPVFCSTITLFFLFLCYPTSAGKSK